MDRVRLFIDEDVWDGLAAALRRAGYDAISVNEVRRKGLSDQEQLEYAIYETRALLTHNIQDFAPLAQGCFLTGVSHCGIIVSRQFEKGELLRRVMRLLESLPPEQLANTLRFV